MRCAPALLAAIASLMLAAPAPAAAGVRPVSCNTSFDVRGAECGTISVPIDRSGKVTGKTSLFVERIAAAKQSKSTIVFFPGGPGAAASIYGYDMLAALGKAMEDHDLLLFDQRGTGRSDYLDCDVALTPTYYVPVGQDSRQFSKTVERCAKKLGAQRAFYTTRETVDDLDAVRQALGIDKFVLLGVSYGTRDAMAYAQAHPDHVDRIVLDSLVTDAGLDPFGLNRVRALPRLLRQLCRGGGCDGITADPVADLTTLVARLQKGPMYSKRPVRLFGCGVRPPVTRSRVFELIQQSDFDPELLSQLPVAIAEAAHGRPYQLSALEATQSPYLLGCGLARVIDRLLPQPKSTKDDLQLLLKSFSPAEQLATVCEESALPWPRDSLPSQRGRLAEQALAAMPDDVFAPLDRATVMAGSIIPMCKFWTAASAAPVEPPTAVPDVPTLILAGLDDLRTPAEDALALARTTTHGHLLLVPDVGHSVISSSACARRGLARFMASEAIGECHRTAVHSPRPARHVQSLQATIEKLLEKLPSASAR
jgi:pimeloyl-ACP methyl ester carboxylesterase